MVEIEIVKSKIAQSAAVSGRNYDDIEVVLASKMQDIVTIKSVIAKCGFSHVGENKVQELLEKFDKTLSWDFIGTLQTNKVAKIIDKVRLIQSVDRESLALVIDKEAKKIGKVQDILLQVNSGKEESKSGFLFDEILPFYDKIKQYHNVRVVGIMAVAPITDDDTLRSCFSDTKAVYDHLKKLSNDIKYLSMGMSNDYSLAIECGSNMIRLGRVVFGERKYV